MCRIKVLGCGDAFHSGGRFQTSFLIKEKQSKILVDCGSGCLQQLKKYGYSTNEITMIIISHLHGDHIGGLPFLLMDMARLKRSKPLHIYSPAGLREICGTVLSMYYPGHEKILDTLPLSWSEYSEGNCFENDAVTIEVMKVNHAAEALPHGIRISLQNKIIAYSGDTGWTQNLEKLADGANLFICECTFYEREVSGHLNYQQLSDKQEQLRCKKILLTHFDEEMLEHRDAVDMPMAEDGMEIFMQ